MTAAGKIASTYDLVEQVTYLFVNVVKARELPTKDITGKLDPYVEVKFGNYKAKTKHFENNSNPVFCKVFAFSSTDIQSDTMEIVVKDKDLLCDDFVGLVRFSLSDIPRRAPPDSALAPQWYRLVKMDGSTTLKKGEIMLAMWFGTQADEALSKACISNAHDIPIDGVPGTRSKVYFSPKLTYLRLLIIAAQDLIPADGGRDDKKINPLVKIQLGEQTRQTRTVMSVNPTWNEEFILIVSEPFDEQLIITVVDQVKAGKDEPLGLIIVPVNSPMIPKNDLNKNVPPKWFSMAPPSATIDEATAGKKSASQKFESKLHLRLSLETAYHVLDEAMLHSSDLQPASNKLKKLPVGTLEIGIIGARNLTLQKANTYCVAKYGRKWVRTRTMLNTPVPQWNEQYTWEVSDPCTVITVAVFNNCHIASKDAKDQPIGKVRVWISTLESDKRYTNFYPLLVVQPSGLKKAGELRLAMRFTCTVALMKMITLYTKPMLPKAHYSQPIPQFQLNHLRHQARQIIAGRLGRAEPPLHREVVEYMLDMDSHMFSLRQSRANFFRVTLLLSSMSSACEWFHNVQSWKNPVTTVLAHALLLVLLTLPDMILPAIFLSCSFAGIWSYRSRPQDPPHVDTTLSFAEKVAQDEFDEELDSFPSTKAMDMVRMRYDRLRSIAGRVQTVAGDLATQGERAQAILSWRDPRATAIFIFFSLIIGIIIFALPTKVISVAAVLYLLRHPMFRSKMPPPAFNFYKRLPTKWDMLL